MSFKPTKLVTQLAIVLLIGSALPTSGQIAVVRSLDHGSFDQVLSSFERACDAPIVEYNLKGKKENADKVAEKIRTQKPDLVLAVGLLAANELRERIPDLPLLYCMVSNPHRYALTGENIVGISNMINLAITGDILFEGLPLILIKHPVNRFGE